MLGSLFDNFESDGDVELGRQSVYEDEVAIGDILKSKSNNLLGIGKNHKYL